MTFRVTIEMGNAAFSDGHSGNEVARILRKIADEVEHEELNDGWGMRLLDFNGNGVGEAITED